MRKVHPMSVTIKDVARMAGVSTATVSKVINEKPSISDETRQHVLHVMSQLSYHPNAQASNFAKKRSENIVFLAVTEAHTAFYNPHMFEILCGAQKKSVKKNITLVLLALLQKK